MSNSGREREREIERELKLVNLKKLSNRKEKRVNKATKCKVGKVKPIK